MKKIVLTFLLSLLLLPLVVQADLLPNSTYCHSIENIDDYPDFVFFAYSDRKAFYINKRVTKDFCEYGFFDETFYIYAINKKDVNQSEIESASNRPKTFFWNNDKIIRSNLPLTSVETNPGGRVTTYWNIKKLNDDEFTIKKSDIVHTEGADTTKKGANKWYSWFTEYWQFILPGLAIIIIVLIIVIRKIKRTQI